MDRVADGGVGWRKSIGGWLHFRGVHVFDPCRKPIDIGIEDTENRKQRAVWKKDGNYASLSKDMKIIRAVDLRMVDTVDFLVINLDLEVHACGTYEELFLANREKKPCIIHVEQGKQACPDWLFGVIPHQMIFSTWPEVHQYLTYIDEGTEIDFMKRWMFFDLKQTYTEMTRTWLRHYSDLLQAGQKQAAREFKSGKNEHEQFLKGAKRLDALHRKVRAQKPRSAYRKAN